MTAAPTMPSLAYPLLRRHPPLTPPLSLVHPRALPPPFPWSCSSGRCVSCQVAVTSDVSSPSSVATEEAEAASKVGSRVRVKVPLKVYHVAKARDLDLCGMEGVIKQYVGLWKGKRISPNLPFKVEFLLSTESQSSSVKFSAHLKEDEFEYLPSDDSK